MFGIVLPPVLTKEYFYMNYVPHSLQANALYKNIFLKKLNIYIPLKV